jgi:hypothetical protein
LFRVPSLGNCSFYQEAAKYELSLPFAQEDELAAKEARLALLNADLNIDGDGGFDVINDTENREDSDREQPGDDDLDEPDEPAYIPRRSDYVEQRTGTYGKSKPSILDDLRTYNATQKPPAQGDAKSNDIDL